MITKLFRGVSLKLHPLKKGDVLYGNCTDFGLNSALERSIHGLVALDGTVKASYWQGDNTYRMTVALTVMPYYVLECEVLSREMDEEGRFVWMKRRFDRRSSKAVIHNMILTGKLTRSKT